jgi:hypothetical protein
VLAHLQRQWSLSGREGFGFLSPTRSACEVGFDAFMEVKCLFSFAPEARKGGKVMGVFLIKKHSSDVAPDAGSGVTGRIRWLTLVLRSWEATPARPTVSHRTPGDHC